jgi:hypothetical protein
MRPPWKRVAHWADKEAFSVEDVRASVEVATEQDCREIRPEFLADIRRVAEEPTLFPDDATGRLAALQPQAGAGLERAVLDRFSFLSASESAGLATLQAAIESAARDCARGRARQIEEHFLRRSSAPRARDMRGRLDAAISAADFAAMAARVVGVDARHRPSAPARQTGLDDGVKLK